MAPTPIDDARLMGLTQANLDGLLAGNEAVGGVVSVYDALARALKYNLDAQVETVQAMLRSQEVRHAAADMLPSLAATAGFASRNNDLATAKLDIPTGIEVPATSVSSERGYSSGDATIGWNTLEFALAYVRAQQASDRHLIALEGRRKAIQRIFEDTRTAYWRAVSGDRLVQRFARLEERAKRAVRNARAARASGAETAMTALSYERELVQIVHTAEKLKHEMALAKSQLAALINIPPGVSFRLADTIEQPDPIVDHLALQDLFAEAVFNRPEIRDIAYRQRINEHEATAAVLELLPGVRLTAAAAFSEDQFLLHNDWTSLGAAVAGNLIKVIQIPARRAVVEADAEVLRQKALAVTATVMTQVLVSRIRQKNAAEQLATARDYREAQSQLVRFLVAEKSSGAVGEQTLIREEMNLLVAEVQYDIALGGLQSASSAVMASVGYDLQGIGVNLDQDIAAIATDIRANWSNRASVSQRGRYLAELEKARREAERLRAEDEQRRKAEAKRAAEAAQKVAADAARERQVEAGRLKREARRARDEARRARRGLPRTGAQHPAPKPVWQWAWPTDASSDALKEGTQSRSPARNGTSPAAGDGLYSGTK